MVSLRRLNCLAALIITACLALWAAPARGETVLVMGTGSPGGNYYAFGQAFAKLVNQASAQTGIRIQAVPSAGSVSNINGLMAGKLQLGLAQADLEFMAWHGKGPWIGAGKQTGLRTLYKIYTEAVTCVAREGINSCGDLRGKRVALGPAGSGTYTNALQALSLCYLRTNDLSQALKVGPMEAMRMLYDGKLDAFFFTVGHPNQTLGRFIAAYRKAQLVPLPPTSGMIEQVPYYVRYFLWTRDYPGLLNRTTKVDTFGIRSYILSSNKVPEKVIHELARLYLANLPRLRDELPFMRGVEAPTAQSQEDLTWNISAPYHDGMKRLLKEMGLSR